MKQVLTLPLHTLRSMAITCTICVLRTRCSKRTHEHSANWRPDDYTATSYIKNGVLMLLVCSLYVITWLPFTQYSGCQCSQVQVFVTCCLCTKETSVPNTTVLYTEDQVYLAGDELLREYVVADSGLIWHGTYNRLRPCIWKFAQFEKDILECSLYLVAHVGKLTHTGRSDPVKTCRVLSAAVSMLLE